MVATFNQRLMGMRSTERAIGRKIAQIETLTIEGLKDGADFLHQKMLTQEPTIPKRSGDLRKSWYKRRVRGKMAVETGFRAEYALYVHEMTDAVYGKSIDWTETGSGAKFLQYAMQRNTKELLAVIRGEIQTAFIKIK